ncbi:hypothetical protein K6959_05875 [Bacillus aquiflavi]|uniref:DUF7408 domain-containing protein n=1 Tax=Bacillus aquiflavi TaxID=2672567 RepID=UPI001CA9AF79|nr:hypothetical protein [Bacillus aquiflavi]UAC49375.1 hypothetical protein K6959_05875 [Bacillus aquiflavi]
MQKKRVFYIFIIVVCFLIFFPTNLASAENSLIKILVEEGYDGKIKNNKGFPIKITVENDGPDFSGDLVVDYFTDHQTGGAHVVRIEAPKGSKKTYTISLPGLSENYTYLKQNEAGIHLYKGGWRTGEEIKFNGKDKLAPQFINTPALTKGILSEDPDRLRELFGEETFQLNKETLPKESLGLEFFDFLIIDRYPVSQLSEKQQQAIVNWVKNGGNLIVGTSPNMNKTLGHLSKFIPMEMETEQTLHDLSFLKTEQSEQIDFQQLTVTTGAVDNEAIVLKTADSMPVIIQKKIGKGSVVQTTFSLSNEQLSTWKGYESWFKTMVEEIDQKQIKNHPQSPDRYFDPLYKIFAAVNEYFSSQFKISFLVIFLIVYLLIVGPGSYYVLRRFDKREHAWWLIPAFSLVASAALFGIGAKDRLSKPQISQLGVYSVKDNGLNGYMAVSFFSNKGGEYQLANAKDEFISIPKLLDRPFEDQKQFSMLEETGTERMTIFPNVEYWSTRTVYGKAQKQDVGHFEVDLTIEEGALVGTIKNNLPFDFENIYALVGKEKYELGNVIQGGTLHVRERLNQKILSSPTELTYDHFNAINKEKIASVKKESMEYITSEYLLNDARKENLPVIIGYTTDPVNKVQMKGKQGDTTSLSLISQPFLVDDQFEGAFRLESNMFSYEIVVIDGVAPDNYNGTSKGALLENGVYDFVVHLPKQIRVDKTLFKRLEMSFWDQELNYSILNHKTGQFEPITTSRHDITDNVNHYIHEDGELIIRLKKSTIESIHVSMPSIRLEGEGLQ